MHPLSFFDSQGSFLKAFTTIGFKFHYPARGRKVLVHLAVFSLGLQSSNSITPRGDGKCQSERLYQVQHPRSNSITPRGDGKFHLVQREQFASPRSNSITPRGDGNLLLGIFFRHPKLCSNSITPRGDGNTTTNQPTVVSSINVQIPLPREGTETVLSSETK